MCRKYSCVFVVTHSEAASITCFLQTEDHSMAMMLPDTCATHGPQHTDIQADDVPQMEEVVVVEAQRRAESDSAQATAARLTAELETALANVLVSPRALQVFVLQIQFICSMCHCRVCDLTSDRCNTCLMRQRTPRPGWVAFLCNAVFAVCMC